MRILLGLLAGIGVVVLIWLLGKLLGTLEWWYHLLTDREQREKSSRRLLRLANAARQAESRPQLSSSFGFTPRDIAHIARGTLLKRGVELSKLAEGERAQTLADMEDRVKRWLMGSTESVGRRQYDNVISRVNRILSDTGEKPGARAHRKAAEKILDARYWDLKSVRNVDAFLEEELRAQADEIKAG